MFKTSAECGLELVSYTLFDQPLSDSTHNTDIMPARAARASFGKQDKTGENPEADVKLMKYLAEHEHLTPFEYQHATFLIECPLFIRSQIIRHRTFSYNEISRRYTSDNLEFWIPDTFRGQHKSSKQASSDEVITFVRHHAGASHGEGPHLLYSKHCEDALNLYTSMVESGVAREQARAVLPQSLLTRFYMGGNLRNWAHFIELRRDEHAQAEVRLIADRLAEALRTLWPRSCESLNI